MRTESLRETAATVTGKMGPSPMPPECRGCEHHDIRVRGDQK